jgi:hypothetical protein
LFVTLGSILLWKILEGSGIVEIPTQAKIGLEWGTGKASSAFPKEGRSGNIPTGKGTTLTGCGKIHVVAKRATSAAKAELRTEGLSQR